MHIEVLIKAEVRSITQRLADGLKLDARAVKPRMEVACK